MRQFEVALIVEVRDAEDLSTFATPSP